MSDCRSGAVVAVACTISFLRVTYIEAGDVPPYILSGPLLPQRPPIVVRNPPTRSGPRRPDEPIEWEWRGVVGVLAGWRNGGGTIVGGVPLLSRNVLLHAEAVAVVVGGRRTVAGGQSKRGNIETRHVIDIVLIIIIIIIAYSFFIFFFITKPCCRFVTVINVLRLIIDIIIIYIYILCDCI